MAGFTKRRNFWLCHKVESGGLSLALIFQQFSLLFFLRLLHCHYKSSLEKDKRKKANNICNNQVIAHHSGYMLGHLHVGAAGTTEKYIMKVAAGRRRRKVFLSLLAPSPPAPLVGQVVGIWKRCARSQTRSELTRCFFSFLLYSIAWVLQHYHGSSLQEGFAGSVVVCRHTHTQAFLIASRLKEIEGEKKEWGYMGRYKYTVITAIKMN